jgi:hypothetical protein
MSEFSILVDERDLAEGYRLSLKQLQADPDVNKPRLRREIARIEKQIAQLTANINKIVSEAEQAR